MPPGKYTISSKTYSGENVIAEKTGSITITSTADNLNGLNGDLNVITKDSCMG